jgi:hypothetical protein
VVSCDNGYQPSGNQCVAAGSSCGNHYCENERETCESCPTDCGTCPTGTIFYVATTGSDDNPGTEDEPFASINHAVSVASAGHTVYVRGGTYQESVSINKSGTAEAPITVANYPSETVVIDGEYSLPGGDWDPLVRIGGAYVIFRGIEVTRSTGEGVEINGEHSQVISVFAHHNMEAGVILMADYSVADGCRIWYNAMHNEDGVQGASGAGWGTGISAGRYPQHATIRHTVSWENWGEGISTFETEYITLEDNVSFNNWSLQMYISDTKYTVAQRNLIYRTPGNACEVGGQYGIGLGDELYNPPSSDNQILNNMVVGTKTAFYAWHPQENVLVANNTFVNSTASATVEFSGGTGFVFQNNIIVQDDGLAVMTGSTSGMTFENNLWSKTFSGIDSSDLVGDALLTRQSDLQAGELTGQWFMLSENSPARDAAVSLPAVDVDFFLTVRPVGALPDIGAHEYTD